jgi:hypothetical protein
VSDLASVPAVRDCRPPTLRALYLAEHALRDDDVQVLARLSSLRGLSWLDLGANGFGPTGAAALAAVEWERLRGLDLHHNRVDAHGAEAIAASPHLARLTHLCLAYNPLGPEGALAIARSPHLGGLGSLDLSGTGLDNTAKAELMARFGHKGWREARFTRPG